MVFKFGIFSGGVEHFADSKAQSLVQPSKEPTTMFKFENSKVRPVTDLPLNLGTQPQNFSTQPHATLASAPAASGHSSGLSSKIPIGEVPNEQGYRRLVELQRHFLRNDGLYVWQKMGKKDKVLNLIIVTGCVLGLTGTFYDLGRHIFKKK